MAELLIFAIIASVATLYSVLPEHRRLRIRYAIHPYYLYLALVGTATIIFLYLFSVWLNEIQQSFQFLCGLICLPAQLWSESLQIAIAGGLTGYIINVLLTADPSIHSDEEMAGLLRGLFSEGRYSTLVSTIADNYGELIGDSSDSLPQSRSLVEKYLTDERFVQNHSQLDPSLAIKTFSDRDATFDRRKFARRYLKSLFEDSTSILYHEIENNRNGETSIYDLTDSNKLLRTLFADATVARDLAVWNPIRNGVNAELTRLANSSDDPYTNRDSLFTITQPSVLFRDPIFIGIRFYDIMTVLALNQEVDHHMFVHYLGEFAQSICDNFKMGPESAPPNSEWPNDYAYLLYEILDALQNTILLAEKRPTEVRRSISNPDCHQENDILKTCLWTFVWSHKAILLSSNIPDSFKNRMSHVLLETYLDIAVSRDVKTRTYAVSLRNYILMDTPTNPIADSNHQEYLRQLERGLRSYDTAKFITQPVRRNLYRYLLRNI